MHSLKITLLLTLSLTLSACFNENEEHSVVLGDVSLGDQLIDLKKAYAADAISKAEYQQMRQGLVQLITDADYAASEDDDDDEEEDEKASERQNKKKSAEEDEGFSWL